MKFFTKEVKIATVAIVGIVVLFFGLHFLKGMPVFSTDNVYYASFKDVNGLSASTPIYADGYQVGNVKSIIYNYQKSGNVLVEFQVDNDLRVPKGSTAEIESDMMGNVKMSILLANNPRERVEPGDTIQGNMNAGLMGSVQQLVPTIAAMLPKIDSILACRPGHQGVVAQHGNDVGKPRRDFGGPQHPRGTGKQQGARTAGQGRLRHG